MFRISIVKFFLLFRLQKFKQNMTSIFDFIRLSKCVGLLLILCNISGKLLLS